jgi:dTMP kinase
MSDGASRGFFIVLEGIDGSGKTTQCRLLAEWLRGQGVPLIATAEPGGTPLGQRVRSLLLDGSDAISRLAELFLFQASRAQLLEQVIRPALAAGQVVLCDRYTLSTIAYQGIRRRAAPGRSSTKLHAGHRWPGAGPDRAAGPARR